MTLSHFTKRVNETISDFYLDTTHFGINLAIRKFLSPRFTGTWELKHKWIFPYLERKYADIIRSYKDKEQPPGVIADNAPIWICWLQGEENMPFLCKKCLESVRKHRGKHPINIITLDNYVQYVKIPNYILEKVGKEISLTHFSDILRANLLADHGGLWLDATIYLTQDLPGYNLPFFSLKQNFPNDKNTVNDWLWTTFFMGGVKGNLMHCYLRDFFHEYWKKENRWLEYLLMDYIMLTGYRNVPAIKHMVVAVPYSCQDLYAINKMLYKPYNADYLNQVTTNTYAFKLNWKNVPQHFSHDSLYYYLFME